MPKWLIILLAIVALTGVVLLEQTARPPAIVAVPAARPPATTPVPASPAPVQSASRVVEVPVEGQTVQTPSSVSETPTVPASPQTPSGVIVAPERPSPLQTPSQTPSESIPATPAVSADPWAGMALEPFLEDAAAQLARLSPETVTWLGIGPTLGMRDDHLDPLTVEAERTYYDLEQAIENHLATYDLSQESPDARLYAETYGAYIRNDLAGRPYADNVYSVSSYMDSYPTYIEWFLTSLHPLSTLDNAEDYLSRLSELSTRFRELEARLASSEELNAVPPRFMLEKAVEQIRKTGETKAEETPFYKTLESALAAVDGIDAATTSNLLDRTRNLLEKEVLPSYLELAEYVSGMAARASDDAGVWKQVNGDAYYAYCLASQTTTTLTADQIYDLGISEVARIEAEVQTAAAALGWDSTTTMPEIFGKLTQLTGTSTGNDTMARCQTILDAIVPRIAPAFDRMPTQKLIVVDGGTDMYFSAGTLDGSRPGQFFAATQTPQPIYELPTTTYHEAVPGHGLQAAYAYEANLPEYIAGLSFTAFAEGWALYAERLAWEMGAYDDNPYGNLGRLQDELFRAVRLVVDPGIHAKHWTYEQAVNYMVENTGFSEDYVRAEVERYIVSPGQAVTYKIGMLKIVELRDRAKAVLGSSFSLPAFHDAVLSHGELPLALLEQQVDAYIARTREPAPSVPNP